MQDTGQRWSQVKAQAKRERIYKKKRAVPQVFRRAVFRSTGQQSLNSIKKADCASRFPVSPGASQSVPVSRLQAAKGRQTLPCHANSLLHSGLSTG